MSSPPPEENGERYADYMETTPAPEDRSQTPMTNGDDSAPAPPLHRTQTGPVPPPSPPPEVEPVDPEACKAAGNKFYKAGQYDKAIEEYSKGWLGRHS